MNDLKIIHYFCAENCHNMIIFFNYTKLYYNMEEIFITEEELEYLTDVPQMVCEEAASIKPRMTAEEAIKACNGITLEEFSKRLDEAIMRLIPNP